MEVDKNLIGVRNDLVGVGGDLAVVQELKRPLMELRQLALVLDGGGESDEEIRQEMLKVAERAMKQIDDLAKINKLKMFEMEPVAIRVLCDEVVADVTKIANKDKLKMNASYTNRQRLVEANPVLLKSIIYNLLINATHYTIDEMQVGLRVYEIKEKIMIEVRDFGPALPVSVWRAIQEGMIREPRDIVMRPGSSALGLYIASRFSEYMHGEIGATRHKDGVSFLVKLPATRQMSIWG